MMKRLLLGAIALAALSASAPAVAADLPPGPTYAKTPVTIPAIYDWSGVYVGFNGGWGIANRCFDQTSPLTGAEGCHNTSGGFAGAQAGYRWQSASWVFGFEALGDWASLNGSNVSLLTPANTDRSRIDAFGLFTGQIGYAWNTALLYLKGGGALIADRNNLVTTGGTIFANSSGDNRWGGSVGAGVEFSFAPNWSAALEYDHLFIANSNTTFTNITGGAVVSTDRLRGDTDLVSVHVNYRWGGPVVSKY